MRSPVILFKALSDETRLRILNLLFEGELCVCELMDALQMPQPRISHQLSILKAADLVVDRREGKWIIYCLRQREEEDLASSVLRALRSAMEGGAWEQDRIRLRETFAKGLRVFCNSESSGSRTPEDYKAPSFSISSKGRSL